MTWPRGLTGFSAFAVIWFGRLVSTFGAALTTFALTFWVFRETRSVTGFAVLTFLITLPGIVVAPWAGVLVDRFDRRRVMLGCEVVSAVGVLALLALLAGGKLSIWHVAVFAACMSATVTFHQPAYLTAAAMLVPPRHLGRANGLVQLTPACTLVAAPVIAGRLVASLGIEAIVIVNVFTHLLSIASLLVVRLSRPQQRASPAHERPSLWTDAAYGWTYHREHPALLLFLGYMTVVSIAYAVTQVMFAPMVLSFSGPDTLGALISAQGGGMVAGALLMSAWGGPPRASRGMLGFGCLFGISLLIVGLRPSPLLIAVAVSIGFFSLPLFEGCGQMVWHTSTPLEIQGRVFAVRRLVTRSAAALAYVVAGPLADTWLEPMMGRGGALATTIGAVIGVGPGRGIALALILFGLLTVAVTAGAWALAERRSNAGLPLVLPMHSAHSS